MRKFLAVGVGSLSLLATQFASAAAVAAIDVTDVTTGLGNQTTPMTSIFTASLGLAVVAAAFHWVRRALGK